MKKSIWIFLLAVLLPSAVLGWLALRSAEEQQIIFERRTAELYQKETEALASTVREAVEAERRVFSETVRRLIARSDADALARDFTNTLTDAWPVKAVGFAIGPEGKLLSPNMAMAAKQPELQRFLVGNSSFLTSNEPAIVYNWAGDNNARGKFDFSRAKQLANNGAFVGGREGNVLFVSPTANDRDAGAQVQKKAELRGVADQQPAAPTTELARKEMSPPAELETSASAPKTAPAKPQAAPPPSAAGISLARTTAGPPVDLQAKSERLLEPMPAAAPRPTSKPSLAVAEEKPLELSDRGHSKANALTPQSPSPGATLTTGESADGIAGKSMGSTRLDDEARTRRSMGEAKKAADYVDEKLKRAPESPPPAPAAAAPLVTAAQSKSTTMDKADGLRARTSGGGMTAEPDPLAGSGPLGNVSNASFALNNTQNRMVEPQQLLGQQGAAVSTLVPETAEFRSLTEGADDGLIARFVQDKLNLIFWLRPPEAPETIFGCLIEAGHFPNSWKSILERHRASLRSSYSALESKPEFVLALLDDRGKPVAVEPEEAFARDWKHPFVASEIGEMLPHWEAVLYLASPTALADSARGLWRTLAFTIVGAVALIALGGWLVVADARRQLALAQQKTDFVSNVSHELKTPLTSIRMFAELMHDRPQPAEKQGQYLRIITVEAERLTRLINNVLDFAKMGRKQKRFDMKPIDLHAVVARAWEGQEMHLRDAGFATRWESAPGPYPVLGDDDALAQVLVNLLSNAEKYSNGQKEVELHTWLDDGHVNISVLDRGMGVPDGDEKKIFEAFYRAHDSLASGIQGSGLGLTLAQRIAREHGGEIKFERREGGGSRFTLRLPIIRGGNAGLMT